MSSLSLYWHPLSQPARAVLWLCKINGVPVELHNVNIFSFENRAPDFLKLNPNHQIPVLVDGNFTIYERSVCFVGAFREIKFLHLFITSDLFLIHYSHSIMRYLCGSRTDAIPDHWYPRNDIRERSKVDQMLDWHHTHLRRGKAKICTAEPSLFLFQSYGSWPLFQMLTMHLFSILSRCTCCILFFHSPHVQAQLLCGEQPICQGALQGRPENTD